MKRYRIKNSLLVTLLVAVAISFFVSIVVMTIISQIILHYYNIKYLTIDEIGVTTYNFIVFLIFTFVILSFIVTFLAMIRKKIMYIKRITESINDIANGNLGLTIEMKGNDELSRLAENVNSMSKELASKFEYERQLEMAKNELITNVSHDLRSPLTSIIGYLDLLRKGKYSDQSQLIEYLDTSYSKSKRLEALINELFEYTRLTSPDVQLDFNEVDLVGLLVQLIGEYVPIFDKEKLTVVKEIPNEEISVIMDVEKMVRVYENLLANAIKYSLKPSEIHIKLEKQGSMAILKASNQVESPPVDDINKLFDRFFIGDKARRNNQGTGLGLAISKRIVELHGGNIRAEYKEGWITFRVEQPIKQ
ncbi:HAMP domain-containing sensor histidine kinase [Neobacillus sp. OS1-32]|jgi:signal transduction histidine kinase|uniref:sensor histidine kinase n=1 Tax=Neobacillus sp. OS1-32 TaxID=3070682 RepID=UPI0027DECB0D|nr:HAMP domain-containing sensor histidine kinase [Neobacillus sp. OS1-32]WML29338.1 HAMP domain-containing sensor histidine kinase [Neobacillus sp. OS1-32]